MIEFSNPDTKLVIVIVIIVVGAAILTRLARWSISKFFLLASSKMEVDPTRYRFFKNAISFIIWLMALASIIFMIPELKALAITLFAGAGILVAIVGLAAQQAFSNIISGIFIIIFRPFRVGDLIRVGQGEYGLVEDITLRHTVIKNFQNQRIIIPNSVIGQETIINADLHDSVICRWVEVGISYDSDIALAKKILQEEAVKHPSCIDNRNDEDKENDVHPVAVRVMSFGDFSVNLRALVWTDDPLKAIQMHSDINEAIKKRFDAEGIEIPFPYRTIVYKKDL